MLGLLGLALVSGCSVPRQVHEPRPYPEIRVDSSRIELHVLDARPGNVPPSVQQLALPVSFSASAQARLNGVLSGHGPALDVTLHVVAADQVELLDARGEMTRVRVKLSLEVSVKDGPVLRHAESESSSDLPRDEATDEEVAFVLEATALDAFDRYFARLDTLLSINRDIAAYANRHMRPDLPLSAVPATSAARSP